jgi:hypothetical protein
METSRILGRILRLRKYRKYIKEIYILNNVRTEITKTKFATIMFQTIEIISLIRLHDLWTVPRKDRESSDAVA